MPRCRDARFGLAVVNSGWGRVRAKAILKFRAQDIPPEGLRAAIEPPARRDEARRLFALFSDVSGFAPRVGMGCPALGAATAAIHLASILAMRKAGIAIRIPSGFSCFGVILAQLGPHKFDRSCLCFAQLTGIEVVALRRLIRAVPAGSGTHRMD